MTPGMDTLVVFDWNGTVMDDLARARQAINIVLSAYHLDTLTDSDVCRTFRLPMTLWMKELGLDETQVADAARMWSAEVAQIAAPSRVDARTVFDSLKASGVLIGVASAATRDAVDADVDRAGLGDRIDFVAAGITDKAEYLRSVRHLRPRALYVGDCEYDIDCARSTGYEAVAIVGGYRSERDLLAARPDIVLKDLTMLISILA
jgi:phosphoglycolate phosphatase